MARLFISYSRTDTPFAQSLAQSLTDSGADVFLDVQDIPAGEKWSRIIQKALDESDLMVLIVSPASIESDNVEDEWQYFLDNQKPVIPLLWLPAKLPFQLNRLQYVNFNGVPHETALANLHAELTRKGLALDMPTPPRKSAKKSEVASSDKRTSAEFARQPAKIMPNATLRKSDELMNGPDAMPIIKKLDKGTAVELIGRTPNSEWLHLKTDEGIVGWLPRDMVSALLDLHTLPITTENPTERLDINLPRRLLYVLIGIAMLVVIGTAVYFSGLV